VFVSKENQSGYNCWSEFYDSYPNPTVAIDDIYFPPFYSQIKNQNVMEIGCGTGRHTKRLLASDNYVTGVDISEGMLSQAKNKIQSEKLKLIHGDFMKDVVPLNKYDALVMSLVLEHIFELDSFFSKSAKYLKTGGYLFISEIHPQRTSQGTFAHFKTPEGGEVHLHSAAHSEEDIQKSSAKAGFKNVAVRNVLGDKQLAHMNPKWEKHFEQPLVQMWQFQLS